LLVAFVDGNCSGVLEQGLVCPNAAVPRWVRRLRLCKLLRLLDQGLVVALLSASSLRQWFAA
ncbi:hypothetical protein U1Q18_020294, partial [Sarracenia purpurea var. burkii]